MSYKVTEEGNISTVHLDGEIDMDVTEKAKEIIMPLIEAKKEVHLNLKEVQYMDSSGISVLIESHQKAMELGTKVILKEIIEQWGFVTKPQLEELEKHFEVVKSQNLVFPKLYSCPSGVLRNSDGINYGISDKSSPVAGGKIEEDFVIKSSKKLDTKVRA